jgi:indole-3-glycerol phosphate synthase
MTCARDILSEIIQAKKKRFYSESHSLKDLKRAVSKAPRPRDFAKALRKTAISVIAEIKRASPSVGIIAKQIEPAKIAKAYVAGGADAVSVLTEEDFFRGSLSDMILVKKNCPDIPVLRKDFIFDELQIYESRAAGADSFLLIASVLELNELCAFVAFGRELGMEPLVETHNLAEIEKALEAKAGIIGVNNRDLRSFKVDISNSIRLAGSIPKNIIKVSESGIKTKEDVKKLREAGFDAILVGETMMKAGAADVRKLIRGFKE